MRSGLMSVHLLSVDATGSDEVPARLTRLLAQRHVQLMCVHMTRRAQTGAWSVQLLVDLHRPTELDLLIKRLNRVIDVVRVRHLESVQDREAMTQSPRRRSSRPTDRGRTRGRVAP